MQIIITSSDEILLKESSRLFYEELWEPLGISENIREDFRVDGDEVVVLALFLGQVIGAFSLIVCPEVVEIRHAAVCSEYRGAGIGRKICNRVQEYALTKGVKQIEVFGRSTAIDFWEKLGFKDTTGWVDFDPFPEHGIRFKKMAKDVN